MEKKSNFLGTERESSIISQKEKRKGKTVGLEKIGGGGTKTDSYLNFIGLHLSKLTELYAK